jgi:hypothetical protein
VHDAPGAAFAHARQHGAAEQHRAAHEEAEHVGVAIPVGLADPRRALRAGRVEDEHVDGAERLGNGGDEADDRLGVRHVGRERRRRPTGFPDRRHDRLTLAAAVVDGDGQTVGGEALGDRLPEAARAAGHERDAHLRKRSWVDETSTAAG